MRPSCYECPFSKLERDVDITIGDYWGIDKVTDEFKHQEGVSLVLVHTSKGQKLFESIKKDIEWIESNTVDCLQPNLINPTNKPSKRDEFWKDYKKGGIKKIINKYGNKPSLYYRIVRKFKRIYKKFIKTN